MNSSLLLQKCPAWFVRLTWIVLAMGSKWPNSYCSEWCYFQDLFHLGYRSFLCSSRLAFFFFIRFVSVHVVHPYCSNDISDAWKKSRFISSDRSDFSLVNSLRITFHAFARHIMTSLSVDEKLLPRYVKLSTNFRGPPFRLGMNPSRLKHVLCFVCVQCLILPAPCSTVGIRLR